MKKFTTTTDADVNLFIPYFNKKLSKNANLSVSVQYSWHEYCNDSFLIEDNTLYLRDKLDTKYYYYFPIPYNVDKLDLIIKNHLEYDDFPLIFANLDEKEVEILKDLYPHYSVYNDDNENDYLYLTENFLEFKGNKYSNKRHHLKRFKKLYPNAIFRPTTKNDIPIIKEFIKEFSIEKNIKDDFAINEEKKAISIFDDYLSLGLKSFVIENDSKIIGVTVIELLHDMIIDHIEKCSKEYEGIYAFMINNIALTFKEYMYFNREDDGGDLGLRYSKTELHPLEMVKKYYFRVLNNLDLIKEIPHLKINDDLFLDELKESYLNDYLKLNLDDDNNKYWGYDYHDDLNNKLPSIEHFKLMVKEDFNNKESFSFMIIFQSKLIGEVVLYNLNNDNSAEFGIRLFKEYQHLGITSLVYNKMMEFIFSTMKLSYLRVKIIKNNINSINFFKKKNIQFLNEDETYYYYQIKQ